MKLKMKTKQVFVGTVQKFRYLHNEEFRPIDKYDDFNRNCMISIFTLELLKMPKEHFTMSIMLSVFAYCSSLI